MGKNQKYLIVAADDFGYHTAVNRGIIDAAGRGIITSASVMVSGPFLKEAIEYSKKSPGFDLGLHLVVEEYAKQKGFTGDKIFSDFLEQFRRFRRIFRKRPSNFSLHWGKSLYCLPGKKKKIVVFLAVEKLAEKIGILPRWKKVKNIRTLFMAREEVDLESETEKILKFLSSPVNILVVHPAGEVGEKGIPPFISRYPLEKRINEFRLLTSRILTHKLKTNGVVLIDFSGLERGDQSYGR